MSCLESLRKRGTGRNRRDWGMKRRRDEQEEEAGERLGRFSSPAPGKADTWGLMGVG